MMLTMMLSVTIFHCDDEFSLVKLVTDEVPCYEVWLEATLQVASFENNLTYSLSKVYNLCFTTFNFAWIAIWSSPSIA